MSTVRDRQPVGSLKISSDVVATIASVAALEIPGVEGVAQPPASMRGMLFRQFGKKAIDVTISDDFVEIDMQVVLKFGAKITEVCSAVQSAVKDSVQTMTGMAVSKVNVLIADIALPQPSMQEGDSR